MSDEGSEPQNAETAAEQPVEQPAQQPAGEQQPAAADAGAGALTDQEKQMGMLCHLIGLAALTCIPFAGIIATLILWQVKKKESEFVDDQGKESLNFQITVTMAVLVLAFVPVVQLAAAVVGIAGMVFLVIGGLKAKEGVRYRYPWALRLVK